MSISNPPKALLTDVFGTVVDWRSSVTNFLTTTAHSTLNSPSASIPSTVRASASAISWPDFAQQWRNSYYHYTRTFDPKTMPWKSIDQHHLDSLMQLIKDHNIEDLWQPSEIHKISLIWHFLDPWPDSSPGLGQLNQKFITSTLSNGNASLLSDLAKHGDLPYKHITGAEDFKAYKPHPDVYLGAAEKLGLKPEECALVAAHLGDLKAARGCGYQTIYIVRPQEEQWKAEQVEEAREWVDMWVEVDGGGFEEVARRFGITGGAGTKRGGGLSEGEKKKIEADAEKGIYHETPAVTDEVDGSGAGAVESGSDEKHHEDPTITDAKI